MNDPLLGPRIKLDRANHHLIELERTEREFFDQNPVRIAFDTNTKPGTKLAKVVLDTNPPEIMHVLAGELIYQLRSALDQTVVAFARMSKGPTKPKHIHFPTGDGFKGFVASCKSFNRPKKKLVGNLRHFDCDLRKAIMRTKPYDGGNDILRSVFTMANIDKHMELIAMSTAGRFNGMSHFHILGGGITLDGAMRDLKEGIIFSELVPDGTITPINPNAKINIIGEITIGAGVPYTGRPLTKLLRSMLKEVGRAHTSFEDILIGRGDMPPRITYWPPNDGGITTYNPLGTI